MFAKDALGKAIYDRLFTWLVGRINDSIKVWGNDSMGVWENYSMGNDSMGVWENDSMRV